MGGSRALRHSRQPTNLGPAPAGPPPGPPPDQKSLQFVMERQQGKLLCWAATVVSLARFYNQLPPLHQCAQAERAFSRSDPGHSCCDQNNEIADPIRCDESFNIQTALSWPEVNHLACVDLEDLTFEGTQREIAARKPVVARIDPVGSGGHYVVLSGYRTTPVRRVSIRDPRFKNTTIPFSGFAEDYEGCPGVCTLSYCTRPRP